MNESNNKKHTLESTEEELNSLKLTEIKLKSILEKATTKQKQLKEEWDKLRNQYEQKQLVKQAYEAKLYIVRREEELKEVIEEESLLYTRAQKIRAEMKRLAKNEGTLKEKLTALWGKTEHYYQSSANVTTKLDWLIVKSDRELSKMHEQLEQEKVNQLAMELSKKLRKGKRCPVCGSTHHHPVDWENGNKVSKEKLEKLNELRLLIQQEYQQNITIKVKFEQLANDIFEHINEPNSTSELSIDEELFQWERTYSSEKDGVVFLQDIFEKVSSEQRALRQDILQITKEKELLLSKYYIEVANKNQLEKLLFTCNLDWEKWSNRLIQGQKDINVLKDQWTANFPAISFPFVEDEVIRMNCLQEEMDTLQLRIVKSIEFIDEKREQLMETTRKIHNKS